MARVRLAMPYVLFALIGVGIWWSNRAAPPPRPAATMEVGICPPCGMDASESDLVEIVDGQRQHFCSDHCREQWLAARAESNRGENPTDPVCHMEVNPAWGFHAEHDGSSYSFCTRRCRDLFLADPERYAGPRCMVCGAPTAGDGSLTATYLDRTYPVCSEEHLQEFRSDPASYFLHSMWGIPDWLYYLSIALVLGLSFVVFESTKSRSATDRPAAPEDRVDLFHSALVARLFRSRPTRFLLQASVTSVFLLIIACGLFGDQNPGLNIAPLLTWTIWWGGLVVLILYAGKAWCTVCPWDAIAGWAERLRLWRRSEQGAGLALRWPRALRNIWLATALFVLLTWIEIGFGVTLRPAATAYLAIAMVVLAVVSAYLFDRKSFCRYGCLVGRVSGLYAMFSSVEIRARDREVCATCTTKECLRGSADAYGCPTYEYPPYLQSNTYCIQCTECLQSCPHENMTVRLRPWGEDLKNQFRPRRDEAYLALIMLSLTSFHGLTMTPVWREMRSTMEGWPGVGPQLSFTAGMALSILVPVIIYAALVWVSHRWSNRSLPQERRVRAGRSYRDYFVRYAYCLLPIALFYHLAHNLEHLLMEGPKIARLVSDPFGWGWNLFGTAGWDIPPLISLDVLWGLQVLLVGGGHIYSLWAASRISRNLFGDAATARRGQWPMLAGMILFSVFSLWLLKQPMEMRSSTM